MARYEREDLGPDDDDSEDEMGPAHHKAKPRRKSHQRPQGSDQIRQAFSKRKKGLVLKAYQLNALTDAKVFIFIANDKGTSWAYSTPGFSNSLDPELLKQLRALARVPESAKLITEVMPDPANPKQPTDTAAAAEHAAARRDDQVPGSVLYTRTAAGAAAARSRSSCSGDGMQASASSDRVPMARSGSTITNTRAQSLAQSEDLPHAKQQHARPPSGSSMGGGGHPGSAAAVHSQCLQQQRSQGGKLPGMEPPTPSGMYNLIGQPAVANNSPSVVSDMAVSSASPSSSKQHMLPLDAAAGVRLAAAAVNAAAANGLAISISPAGDEGWSQQQQQAGNMQWLQPQELQQQAAPNWQQYGYPQQQQQYLQQQQQQQHQHQHQQAGDSWVEVKQQSPDTAAGATDDRKCHLHMCSTGYSEPNAGISASTAAAGPPTWPPAPQQLADNQQQQHLDQLVSSSVPNSTNGGAGCSFEHMLRGLPPLRIKQQAAAADWRDADGCHSAPAGAAATAGDLGMPSLWPECGYKPEHLRQFGDAGLFLSYGGYSSYGGSVSCTASPHAQPAHRSSAAGKQAGSAAAGAAGNGPVSAAASKLLAQEAVSADQSPTAALSSQLCSLLSMDSPVHEGLAAAGRHRQQQQQQQQPGWQEHAAAEALAYGQALTAQDASHHLQQQNDQGTYIPLTDDLVSDPLMEMLMDQAMAGGSRSRPGSYAGQQQQQHVSIMDATLQQHQQQPRHQQLPGFQDQYFGGSSQQGQISQQPQMQHSMMTPSSSGASLQQQQEQQQLLQLSSLLQHFPLPPKSNAEKPAWQEHVRNVLLSLQLQPEQQQQLMALIRDREQQALLARAASPAAGGSGSTTCSPNVMVTRPQQQQQQQILMPAAGHCGGSNAGVNYLPRGAGTVCVQQGGGKQRHGPSRLSATSPAIDAAAAAIEANALPYSMQGSILEYVGQSGLASAEINLPQQQQQQQQQQQPGAAEAPFLPVFADRMPLSVPMSVPVSLAAVWDGQGMHPAMMQRQWQQVCNSSGMAAASGYGCTAQMMPMPISTHAMTAVQPIPSFQQQLQQQGPASVAAVTGSPHAFAPLQARQASSAPGDPGAAAAAAAAAVARPAPEPLKEQQQQPASPAPGSLLAGLHQQHWPSRSACSSPLKRTQPYPGPFGAAASSAAVIAEVCSRAMSPLKRACREAPEPSSFTALLQTQPSDDDAVAWAASAAANNSVKMAGNMKSCDGFPEFDSLPKVASGAVSGFATLDGSTAAATHMAAGHAVGDGEAVRQCEDAAVGGEGQEVGSMMQAAPDHGGGAGSDGGLLGDCDTEMGDASGVQAAAAAAQLQEPAADAGAESAGTEV